MTNSLAACIGRQNLIVALDLTFYDTKQLQYSLVEEQIREVITCIKIKRLEIQHSGNENQTVDINKALIMQIPRKSCCSRCPITFTNNKFGIFPTLIAGQIKTNKFCNRFDIFFYAMKVFSIFWGNGPAKSSRNRVEKTKSVTSKRENSLSTN